MGRYKTVSIPIELLEKADKWIGKHGYRSRAQVIVDGVRRLLEGLERGGAG